MNKIQALFKKLTKPTLISVAILIAIVTFIIFTSWILYNHTVTILTQNLKDRFLTTSIIEATNIDSKDLNALQTESDWQKPEWAKVVNQLHKAKYSSKDIVFMYLFRKTKDDPTKMEFVGDADSINPFANTDDDPTNNVDSNRDGKVEPDGPDKLQWPGQPFPEAADIPEAYEAYNGPITVKDIYTDEYGSVLTSFAPIKDENGNTVAVLGTDIKADDFFTTTRQTLEPFLIFIASLSLIISILILIITFSWKKYSKSLQGLLAQRESLVHLVTHKVKGSFTRTKILFASIADGTFGEISPEIKKRAEQGLEFDNAGIQTVDLVLNTANLQSGLIKYDMKNIDFKALVEQSISEKKIGAEAKGLKLETEIKDDTYNVLGDSIWLKEAVTNLIDNSIKYTRDGKITVGLEKSDDKILLSIKDTGVGITEEDKKNLFTEGGRGKDSVKVNVDSTGYGLFTVKLIVEAHKGKAWAESEGQNKGSTFFVELPVIL